MTLLAFILFNVFYDFVTFAWFYAISSVLAVFPKVSQWISLVLLVFIMVSEHFLGFANILQILLQTLLWKWAIGDAHTDAESAHIESEMCDKRWWVSLSRTRQARNTLNAALEDCFSSGRKEPHRFSVRMHLPSL